MSDPISFKKNLQTNKDKILYIIDISSFIFRAYHAIRPLSAPNGEPTAVTLGVMNMLKKLSDATQLKFCCVAYDHKDNKEKSYRNNLFPLYKAHRSEPPQELLLQIQRIQTIVEALQMPSIMEPGYEADDIIAALAAYWEQKSHDHQVVILSGDKDLMQCINDQVSVWDTLQDRYFDANAVMEKFGVHPHQIIDYLALVGDSSDNIPGVEGIGSKGASALLTKYGSLKNILDEAQKDTTNKKLQRVISQTTEALLSQKLATLQKNCLESRIAADPQWLENLEKTMRWQLTISPIAQRIFQELGFQQLIQRWNITGAPQITASLFTAPTVCIIATVDQLLSCIEVIQEHRVLAFDLETTGLNPHTDTIVGIALCIEPKKFSYYIPLAHQDSSIDQLSIKIVLDHLKPILQDKGIKKIGQNLKFDIKMLKQYDVQVHEITDTMLMAYVLEPSGAHNLAHLAKKYMDYTGISYEELCGTKKNQISFDQVTISKAAQYAGEDAWLAYELSSILEPMLKEKGLYSIYQNFEIPLVPVLSDMEWHGVLIDNNFLSTLEEMFSKKLEILQNSIQAYSASPININSPKQIGNLLFEELKLPGFGKTKSGFSTDVHTLKKLKDLHPIADLLLEYREYTKLLNTYVIPLQHQQDKKSQRIYANFHQTGTVTGRLSSSDPNLQNIPTKTDTGVLLRKAFIAPSQHILLSADYNQIELRVLAHMSEDPVLCEAFQEGKDIHSKTAGDIFKIPVENVAPEQRSIAKAINFGLMYGKTAFGLAEELKISKAMAQNMIETYFQQYAGVKKFFEEQIEKATKHESVESFFGRKRSLPEITSSIFIVANNAKRIAMNSPIQSTASDLMKLVMIKFHDYLLQHNKKTKILIQVHDELLLEVPNEEVELISQSIVDCMENITPFKVPLKVNLQKGLTWMDL